MGFVNRQNDYVGTMIFLLTLAEAYLLFHSKSCDINSDNII